MSKRVGTAGFKLFFLILVSGSTCFGKNFCQLPTGSKVEVTSEILIPANTRIFEMDFRCFFKFSASDTGRIIKVGRIFNVKSVAISRHYGCNAEFSDINGNVLDISLDCLNASIDELNHGTLGYIKITPAKPGEF